MALEASAVLAEVNFLPAVLIMYHICQWTSDLSLDYLNTTMDIVKWRFDNDEVMNLYVSDVHCTIPRTL